MASSGCGCDQRFDGITVANRPLQERYGGTGGFGVTPFAASSSCTCRVIWGQRCQGLMKPAGISRIAALREQELQLP